MERSFQNVTAIIPTRGDHDLTPVLQSLPFDQIITTREPGLYCRYESVKVAKHDLIFTQDDDCIVDVAELLRQYQGGVLCNMPARKRHEYPDGIALVGWGALFPRSAVEVFERYFWLYKPDALFLREADRVFTGLQPVQLCDVQFTHLPKAHGRDRMGAQPDHLRSLGEIRKRIYDVRRTVPVLQPA